MHLISNFGCELRESTKFYLILEDKEFLITIKKPYQRDSCIYETIYNISNLQKQSRRVGPIWIREHHITSNEHMDIIAKQAGSTGEEY